ncbi:rho GTPase-activating protein 19 [Phlebotomus argentipes]|uniref:rho GTPase-activating protein 19 n=1 Tax=Phlebotomus argentipes TaxID=94469 RepID=UPI0028935E31|nr:rho GTPase-activating protein 19 [Phlebotomus argentipes]
MSNRLLADRLRFENPEQFSILVRMHLSFELDLNTEEFANEPDDRGIFRKLNRLHRKAKGCASAKAASPVDGRRQPLTPEMLEQTQMLMDFLTQEQNIIQEGIFRRTGALSRQTELKNAFCQGQKVDLSLATFTVHDCASVLKAFLADLPEPLLTDAYHSAHCQLAQLMASGTEGLDARLTNCLQLLLLLLPEENRQLLERLLALLHRTTLFVNSNKMSASSLATLFTPHLICPRKLSPEALHAMSQQMSPVVAFMVAQGVTLFEIPLKLATDIQAYFAEQTKKRSLTPGQVLDESITSDSTAATVYSFVDREKTAQAHNSNYTTDTALAQLYAHIQSLPESSRKRKLIKQFNKENGQGTPLMMNREKSAKMSLGDSIKRHIFHRSLLSRTPKRSRTPLSNISETPPHPYGSEKRPKTRVLFHTVQLPSSEVETAAGTEESTQKVAKEEPEEAPRRLSRKFPSESNLWSAEERGSGVSGSQSLPDVSSERCMRLSGKVAEVGSLNHSDESSDRSLISPITKSTRRMPKYMQESIMTPRSRKPVMLLGATLGGSVSEERSRALDDCDFREEDEDEYASSGEKSAEKGESLSSPFRDYLFTRSVLTASPADLSFSSQPDDFGSATDIRDLSESEMSKSLLFCLDGNQPQGVDLTAIDDEDVTLDGVVAKKRCLHPPGGLDETCL